MTKRKSNQNKQNVKKIENMGGFDGDIKGVIFVVVGVLVFLSLFYLLTVLILNKDKKSDKKQDDTTETVISYDKILLGRSLSMSDGEYLVIYYDASNDEISSTYSSLVSTYNSKEEHLKIYTVDMSNSFNSKYVTDGESNKEPSSVSDFAINGPTLIKVSENRVAEYIEGEEGITSYLS